MKYLYFIFKFNTNFYFLIVLAASILAVLLEYSFVLSVPILLDFFLQPERSFIFKDFFSEFENLLSKELILFAIIIIFLFKNIFFF